MGIDWNEWQQRFTSIGDSVKDIEKNVQGFQNTITPLLQLSGIQKANNTEAEIAKGQYNEPAGAAVNSSGNSFPIPGGGSISMSIPLMIGGALIVYLLVSKKGRRK